jgi:hypothetical protein
LNGFNEYHKGDLVVLCPYGIYVPSFDSRHEHSLMNLTKVVFPAVVYGIELCCHKYYVVLKGKDGIFFKYQVNRFKKTSREFIIGDDLI